MAARVLNGELCTERLQKLIYLCLSTDCFMRISHQIFQAPEDWREIFMKLYFTKYKYKYR